MYVTCSLSTLNDWDAVPGHLVFSFKWDSTTTTKYLPPNHQTNATPPPEYKHLKVKVTIPETKGRCVVELHTGLYCVYSGHFPKE